MMPPVKLPVNIINRFKNKTIAIVGYEQDQVFKYDNNSNCIEESSYQNKVLNLIRTYEYDINGILYLSAIFFFNGT